METAEFLGPEHTFSRQPGEPQISGAVLNQPGVAAMKDIRSILCLLPCLLIAVLASSQTALVTQPIDETRTVVLHGSVHPLAQPKNDRGAVADNFAAGPMILLLNRPPQREAALQQLLRDLHTPGSPSFHKWLTPDQLGAQFGPAASDVQAAAGWLGSHGFEVEKTSKSRQFIEFSGTTGQLREAFHTQIHEYNVNGITHYANATDVSIPLALASLIRGVAPLNNFNAQPNVQLVGSATLSPGAGKTTPRWTFPGPNGAGTFYALAPEDFATQYDLAPLYKAGVTGTGQTIGILNDSNVDLSLVRAFRKLFGVTAPAPQIVIDGSDPGTLSQSGVSIEAYLDVEEAGAVAPGATVNLYIGDASSLLDPLYLAGLHAVDDNQASVLSVSFGACEGFLQQSGNALWSDLWEQAAAQGQTVLVSSGDSDSADCDNTGDLTMVSLGLAVNGLSSTPWNVSVGGTDFYYSDYATGGVSAAGLWNQTNDANNGSLKAPLPEQVWDTAYGLNATGAYDPSAGRAVPGAGGGASSCINSAPSATQGSPLPFVCGPVSGSIYGYAKPAWQSGAGVPADGVRDVPDVSLFASNGLNFSGYPICATPGDCVADPSGNITVTIVGGTSAPTPAMAAIMALVDQKYGRQGQADFTLYPLAHQTPAAFHDVTLGSNNVPCVPGTPDCSADTNGDGFNSLQQYPAAPGYDLASGLGSVDAGVLVNQWNSITFQPTTTALQVSPTSAIHGNPVTVTVTVKPSSGSGTPQGSVSILTDAPTPLSASEGVLTLHSDGTASGTLTDLPGGNYQVWAQYSGDAAYRGSESGALTVAITPVAGSLALDGFYILNASGSINPAAVCQPIITSTQALGGPSGGPIPNGTSVLPYFLPLAAVAVANGALPGLGTGTGNVTYTLDGATMATVSLNALGYATWISTPLLGAGSHSIGAAYSGDASYSASTASPFTFTVAQGNFEDFSVFPGALCGNANPTQCTFSAGDNLAVAVRLEAKSCSDPTGPVTVNLGSLSQKVTLTPDGMGQAGETVLAGKAVFQSLPAGTYPLSASYPGDANFQSENTSTFGSSITVVATPPPGALLPSTTTAAGSVAQLTSQSSAPLSYTVNVTGGAGSSVPPTGNVILISDGAVENAGTLAPSGPNTSSATITVPLAVFYLDFGVNQVTALYSGDAVYQSSASAPSTLDYIYEPGPDFLLAPQSPQITVQAGSSGTVVLNLAPLNGLSGAVSLTCASSSTPVTCSLNPATVMVNGLSTATLTVSVAAQTAAQTHTTPQQRRSVPVAPGVLAFALFLLGGRAARRFRRSIALGLCLAAALFIVSCGSNSGTTVTKTPPPPPPPPTVTTYSVVVTATANGVIHNAKVTVLVP
ncbi:MAG TPA: Ig-like domain repeat protein [Acidobacteriaceae bacterium]|jgi:hypothetical protein|nr:Ig-like domain repeat protein [Acidobacteriaceae bacterium]